jgi:hypothetical protein
MSSAASEKDFWDRLESEAWGKTPAVFRAPFADPLLNAHEAFQAWRLAMQLRSLGRGDKIRFYRNLRPVSNIDDFAPALGELDFGSYFDRLQREHGSGNYGLWLSGPHVASPLFFRRALGFLHKLYRKVGFPVGGSIPDLFAMTHKSSFLRLHKDAQDVFTFVVEGRRTFLLWPFEYFVKHENVDCRDPLQGYSLPFTDVSAHRNAAVVIEANAGDVIYWPAEWWHIGESPGGAATTVGIGVLRSGNPMQHVSQAFSRSQRDLPFARQTIPFDRQGSMPYLRGYRALLAQTCGAPEFQQALDLALLDWITGAGMSSLPEPISDDRDLPDDAVFRVTSPSAIAWTIDQGGLACSIAGRPLRLANSPDAVRLLERVCEMETFHVGNLLGAMAAGAAHSQAFAEAKSILNHLVRHHALARA